MVDNCPLDVRMKQSTVDVRAVWQCQVTDVSLMTSTGARCQSRARDRYRYEHGNVINVTDRLKRCDFNQTLCGASQHGCASHIHQWAGKCLQIRQTLPLLCLSVCLSGSGHADSPASSTPVDYRLRRWSVSQRGADEPWNHGSADHSGRSWPLHYCRAGRAAIDTHRQLLAHSLSIQQF